MKVCVLGLGYIGLPTAAIMATNGYEVLGVDANERIVNTLKRGDILIEEPGLATVVNAAMKSEALTVETSPKPADVFIVAVPTPFKKEPDGDKPFKEADLSCVIAAAESILPHLKKGAVIILESTSPPGTTANVVKPILERSGLQACKDFYLAYSPERVLPGAILKEMITNDRVVGGICAESARRAREIYERFVEGKIFETDSTTAEMVKLAENAFRDINIAYANELARICAKVGSDVWDVINLANRHPRVNILRPGPGVGGHCIAVDPWFLVEVDPEDTRLIRTAREVNDAQSSYVVEMIKQVVELNGPGRIAFLGLTYKANINDTRESPSFPIIKYFYERNHDLIVYDPFVKQCDYPMVDTFEDAIATSRYLVFLVEHKKFLALPVVLKNKIIIDAKNIFGRMDLPEGVKIYTLGKSEHKIEGHG